MIELKGLRAFLVGFFMLLCQFVSGDPIPVNFDQLSAADNGLISDNINALHEDKFGLLWIGTNKGLAIFNGYTFTNFDILKEKNISAFYEDVKGNLWIGTHEGLYLYDRKKDFIFKLKENKNTGDTLKNPMITALHIMDDTLFTGGWRSLSMIYPISSASEEGVTIKNFDLPVNTYISKIKPINKKDFILGLPPYMPGVYLFDNGHKKIIPAKISSNRDLPEEIHIRDLITMKDGLHYLLTYGEGIIVCEEINGVLQVKENVYFENKVSRKNRIFSGYCANDSTLILASEVGMAIFNTKSKKAIFPSDYSSKQKYVCTCVSPSKKDNIWIGTVSLGIYHYSKRKNRFSVPTELSDLRITRMSIHKHELLAHTYDQQLVYIDTRKMSIIKKADVIIFYQSASQVSFFKTPTESYIIDKGKKIPYEFPKIERSQFIGVHKNNIIFSFHGGTSFENYIDKTIKSVKFRAHCSDDNFENFYNSNYRIQKFNISTNQRDSTEILPVRLSQIFYSDHMVIGINSRMIIIYDSLLNKVKYIQLSSKYNVGGCRSIEKNGDLIFAGTDIGLLICNIRTESCRFFRKADGLPANDVHVVKYDKEKKLLYAGTWNGLAVIDPSKTIDTTNLSRIYLTALNVLNEKVYPSPDGIINDNIINAKEIKLKYWHTNFEFEFALTDYSIYKDVDYAYKLEGYDTNWTYARNNNFATFTKVPPGAYRFIVKAQYNGKWCEPTSIALFISPPFWQTWWFRLLVFLLIIGSALGLHFYRLHHLIAQKQLLDKQVKEKTKELVDKNCEIESQAEILKDINTLLEEKQEEIKLQSEELYQHNQQLQKVISTKDKLFSIIAHDLRNPFHSIMGFSKLILDQKKGTGKIPNEEFIEAIHSSSSSASVLLENLLTWSKAQSKQVKISPVVFQLKQLVQETFTLLKISAENKKINLISEIHDNTVIFADKEMIQTVIRNLVNNAIKFTEQNGSIKIRGEIKESSISIFIEDNGVGIPNDKVDNLFKVDQIKSTEGTSGERGTGLGLAICKEFVEKNNGNISVNSRVGKGTTFVITLPNDPAYQIPSVVKEPEIVAPADIKQEAPNNGLKNEKILIVDDNADIILNLKSTLEGEYLIYTADDGDEGFKSALENVPDLILSDVSMPIIDGYDFCHKIKTSDITAHIPVILLTAKDKPSDKISGYKIGADEYFVKPIDASMLIERIRNLIQGRKNLRDHFLKNFILSSPNDKIKTADDNFLTKAISVIEKYMDDEKLSIYILADELAISISQLNKKLKALTNQTPTEFIRTIRLKKAANLLKNSDMNINEVYPLVGFSNRVYFSKAFTELFGLSPSKFKGKF